MRPFPFALLLLALAPAAGAQDPSAARLDAVLRVEPLELPGKRDGGRELNYAFGKKEAPEEAQAELVRVLGDRLLFDSVVGEGPADFSLALHLSEARSSFSDWSEWQSKPSEYEVSATVGWAFLDASGEEVAVGSLQGSGRVGLNAGPPRRPDARIAWSRLLEDAAVRAFTSAFEMAAFGNEPPAKGGWIAAPKGR